MPRSVGLRNTIWKEPLPTGAAILMASSTPVAHSPVHEKVNAFSLRSERTEMTEGGSPI